MPPNLKPIILRIAVPTPLRQYFDYLAPADCITEALKPGIRIRVPFQHRELIGIFLEIVTQSTVALPKLKQAYAILDREPVIPPAILQLCLWAADYYHYPIGEVLASVLPTLLRQGKSAAFAQERYWQLANTGDVPNLTSLQHAPRQMALLNLLTQHPEGLTTKQLLSYGMTRAIISALQKKNWLTATSFPLKETVSHQPEETPLTLNAAQQTAVSAIRNALGTFQVFLLDGITGSGKTEVYLQSITYVLQQQKQVLVLVPEIGLTPQTISRFRNRFAVPVVALNSGLSDKERLNAWLLAKAGNAKIVIGTRSAIFSPFQNLGLIIIDEEHDLSFKQQDGFRYHARDLAVMRAHFDKIPVILGSATPSLEVLHKAKQGRFQHLVLPTRAGHAMPPSIRILDIRNLSLEEGISPPLLAEIEQHLQQNNQVMLFLNRRGFAPVLMCHTCGWMAECKRCDKRFTYHQKPQRLHCHHCGARRNIMISCEACQSKELHTLGLGTERLEYALAKHFPTASIARIDRDTTQRKGQMEEILDSIQRGNHHILIGTQMLAKGHHFPNVTLVAIVDVDSGFFSTDFRAIERMGQLMLQVAGRAGRVEKPGTVLIQTRHPDHFLLQQLVQKGYQDFALSLLSERKQAILPPFTFFALFRAEAQSADEASQFLQQVKQLTTTLPNNIYVLGPIPAPMPRRAGYHRAQLLVQAKYRPQLQGFLKTLLSQIEKIPGKQRIRWSLDVDPLEMF